MLFVVDRDVRPGGSFVLDIGIEFRSDTHWPASLFCWMVSAVRPPQTILVTLVIGEFETVPDGPVAFRRAALDIRYGLPDHKVKECGAILASTSHW